MNAERTEYEPFSFTLEMLIDYLRENGFAVLRRPDKPVLFADALFAESIHVGDMGDILSCTQKKALVVCEDCAGKSLEKARAALSMGALVVAFAAPSEGSQWEKEDLGEPLCIVSGSREKAGRLKECVLRFLLDKRLLVSRLRIASGERGSFQALMDEAEWRFGCFMNITDAHYRLLAYTKHHMPEDEINQSLISMGYHSEEHLRRQHMTGYLLDSVANQAGVRVWAPSEAFPYHLVTGVMRTSQQYAGHVLMAYLDKPSQGTVDEFDIFLLFCERLARRQVASPTFKDSPQRAFVSKLAVTRGLDGAYVRERAELLGLPSAGVFVLVRIASKGAFGEQAGHMAEDLDGRFPLGHVTFVREGHANALLWANTVRELWEAVVSASKTEYGSTRAALHLSDPFYRLTGLYYAAQEVDAIDRYQGEIALTLRAASSDASRVFEKGRTLIISFRDAFAFFWRDARADEGFASFVLSHLLVTAIAKGGAKESQARPSSGMDDLALLFVYLANERKATKVGQMCGLHRNGVLYRIEKMEKRYGLDLNDPLTRDYLRASTNAKLVSSCDFKNVFEESLRRLLGEET